MAVTGFSGGVPSAIFLDVIHGNFVPVGPVPRIHLDYINRKHGPPGALKNGKSEFNILFLSQLHQHLWAGAPYATYVGPGSSPNTHEYRLAYNPSYVITGTHGRTGNFCTALNYVINHETFVIFNAFPSL